MRFIKLEKLINLHEGYQRCFNIEGYPLLLIHLNNTSRLFLNQCPHQNKALGDNCLQGDIIRCPWHGIEYEPSNGQALSSNHKGLRLSQFKLDYEENFIGFYMQENQT